MKLYDISVPLTASLPHWPGERGFEMRTAVNDDVAVSEIHLGIHTGTHMDAPLHFIPGAADLDGVALESCVGKARVLDVSEELGAVSREILERKLKDRPVRLLLKTRNSGSLFPGAAFNEDFAALSPQAAAFLASLGVRLIGMDYLSVEGFKGDGTVHRTLLKHGVVLLEGINLHNVPEGDYILMALPLKIAGAEGSPVRAVLAALDRSW